MCLLTAFSTNCSPLILSLCLNEDENRGSNQTNGLWKFNNSTKTNSDFITISKIYQENINDNQSKWKLLKYDINIFKRKQSRKFKYLESIKTLAIIKSLRNVKIT